MRLLGPGAATWAVCLLTGWDAMAWIVAVLTGLATLAVEAPQLLGGRGDGQDR